MKEFGETAVCNLGSINLRNHLIRKMNDETNLPGWSVDWKKLKSTISVAMRMLDNVIDINFYPTEEARKSNLRHRPVGLGSMGWHDLFYNLDILFDSEEATSLSDKMYEFIDRLVNIALPRIKDFRGLSSKGFDKFGNFTFGVKEHIIFPEVNFDKVDKIRGLDITIVIKSNSKEHSLELLKKFNFPFREERSN